MSISRFELRDGKFDFVGVKFFLDQSQGLKSELHFLKRRKEFSKNLLKNGCQDYKFKE
jgi:hypothetical protein